MSAFLNINQHANNELHPVLKQSSRRPVSFKGIVGSKMLMDELVIFIFFFLISVTVSEFH